MVRKPRPERMSSQPHLRIAAAHEAQQFDLLLGVRREVGMPRLRKARRDSGHRPRRENDWPSPVPAASNARVPPGSGLPGFRTQKSSGGRCSILWPVAPRSFNRTTCGTFSSLMRLLVSTIQGRLVARTVPLITGPAMPKPAATMRSLPRGSAAWRENSLTMRSNCANSLLAKRCLKTA